MDTIRQVLQNEENFNQVAKVAFDTTDTDGSGLIEKQELAIAMKQIAEDIGISAPSKEEVQEVFEVFDIDQSGKLDFNEFKRFVRNILETMISEQ